MSWKQVPGSRRMFLAPDSGRSGRSVRALCGSSDWRRDLVDRAGVAAVAVAGTGPLGDASPPAWPAIGWDELSTLLAREVPGLHILGAVTPRQVGRPRLSILARMAGNDVVMKLSGGGESLRSESDALELLARRPLPGIATPFALAFGALTLESIDTTLSYLVTSSISVRRQRPAIDEPLRTFESDLAERLAALPGDDGSGIVPIHGDLTPWNLRRTPRGLALFDWEAAGWGAPGSDLLLYRSTCDEVRRPWNRRAAPR